MHVINEPHSRKTEITGMMLHIISVNYLLILYILKDYITYIYIICFITSVFA